MYRIFCRNAKNFFRMNLQGESENDFRMEIAQPLKGLADIKLYEKWKSKNNDKYNEVNNLVYQINSNKDTYHAFETFSHELWGYGYESFMSSKYDTDIIQEQLKLIHLLLGTQYWVELDEAN